MKRTRTTARASGQAGFTLVELIVAIVLMGIVAGPLIESFIDTMRTTAAASNSLGSSHDAQLTDYYLEQDALGATPSTPSTTPPATWLCASAAGVSVGSGPVGVVQFSWTQANVATGTTLASGDPGFASGLSYEVDYVSRAAALTRYSCTVSGSVATLLRTTTVASTLSLSAPAPVSATVNQDCASPGVGVCTTVQWTDATGRTLSTVLFQRGSS